MPEPTDEKARQKLAFRYREGDGLTRAEDNTQLAIRECEIDVAQPENRGVLTGLALVCPSEGRVDKADLGLARCWRLCEDCVFLRLLLVEVLVDAAQRDIRLQDMDKHCGTSLSALLRGRKVRKLSLTVADGLEGRTEDLKENERGERRLRRQLLLEDCRVTVSLS